MSGIPVDNPREAWGALQRIHTTASSRCLATPWSGFVHCPTHGLDYRAEDEMCELCRKVTEDKIGAAASG